MDIYSLFFLIIIVLILYNYLFLFIEKTDKFNYESRFLTPLLLELALVEDGQQRNYVKMD